MQKFIGSLLVWLGGAIIGFTICYLHVRCMK